MQNWQIMTSLKPVCPWQASLKGKGSKRCESWIFDSRVLWSSVPGWLEPTANTFSPSKNLSAQNLNSFSYIYLQKQILWLLYVCIFSWKQLSFVCGQHVCVYPPPSCSSTRQLFDSSIKLFPIFRFFWHQNISLVNHLRYFPPPQQAKSRLSFTDQVSKVEMSFEVF